MGQTKSHQKQIISTKEGSTDRKLESNPTQSVQSVQQPQIPHHQPPQLFQSTIAQPQIHQQQVQISTAPQHQIVQSHQQHGVQLLQQQTVQLPQQQVILPPQPVGSNIPVKSQ